MRAKTLNVSLMLADPAHLFHEPRVDPLSRYYQPYSYTSGLDYMADLMYAHPRFHHVEATISLPSECVTRDIEADLRDAIQTYCTGHILRVNRTTAGGRTTGLVWLVFAVIALFLALAASHYLARSRLPFAELLANGLTIAGWVLLWYPLDTLLISYWVERLDNRIYRRLADIDLHVVPEAQ